MFGNIEFQMDNNKPLCWDIVNIKSSRRFKINGLVWMTSPRFVDTVYTLQTSDLKGKITVIDLFDYKNSLEMKAAIVNLSKRPMDDKKIIPALKSLLLSDPNSFPDTCLYELKDISFLIFEDGSGSYRPVEVGYNVAQMGAKAANYS